MILPCRRDGKNCNCVFIALEEEIYFFQLRGEKTEMVEFFVARGVQNNEFSAASGDKSCQERRVKESERYLHKHQGISRCFELVIEL
jgi:hypothetical protein